MGWDGGQQKKYFFRISEQTYSLSTLNSFLGKTRQCHPIQQPSTYFSHQNLLTPKSTVWNLTVTQIFRYLGKKLLRFSWEKESFKILLWNFQETNHGHKQGIIMLTFTKSSLSLPLFFSFSLSARMHVQRFQSLSLYHKSLLAILVFSVAVNCKLFTKQFFVPRYPVHTLIVSFSTGTEMICHGLEENRMFTSTLTYYSSSFSDS